MFFSCFKNRYVSARNGFLTDPPGCTFTVQFKTKIMAATNHLSFGTGSSTAVTAIDRSYPEKAISHPFLEKWAPEDATTPIYWQTSSTPVGEILVAATAKGVCFLGFNNDSHEQALDDLRMRFPNNPIEEKRTVWHDEAQRHLDHPRQQLPVHLHLKGTIFQLGIWERLLQIPFGGLTTYSELGNGPRNARATGSAVGANPVSIIVPCHRVVRADGSYEGYYWGPALKTKLLIYESI
jgi:AraC family transcriptional regulator of adaptative response/methylated-DNA-[protein]-cysteine methyltransferase